MLSLEIAEGSLTPDSADDPIPASKEMLRHEPA
jgi:hypothetical protein